ncbi:23 kDa integral membrane protein isoform X2 [Toxorhynchites rutilus septentrionalis]|uniref:23 kDa integral membrane protein isoform X2 n=1 Tax=Toxorhynchites rutilus septentrionalis TaxID=329112 RepID=UPI00247935CE|nr:23 kDa integral membrane protein isoform X2 [Toxorhynchites rutilus septentrionalis]
MRLSARIKCFRYLVYAYIVLISFCGYAQLVIGAFLLWNHRQYSMLVNDKFWEPFGVSIALGMVTELLCYLGWTSTSKKNRCYLGTFCVFLVLLIVVQFLIGSWVYAATKRLVVPAEQAIEVSFSQFITKPGAIKDQTHIWNLLQRDFQCCGLTGKSDYKTEGRPWSCTNPVDNKDFENGCTHALIESVKSGMLKVAIVAVVAAFTQSLGVFCVIELVTLLKRPKVPLQNGDNHSMRVKRPREMVPLSATASSSQYPPAAPTLMMPHSSTKPPIAQKPIIPKIDPPIIKQAI